MPRPTIPIEQLIAERFASGGQCTECDRLQRRLLELLDRLDAALTKSEDKP